MKKSNVNNLDYPDVKPLLDKQKQVIVKLEPARMATIVGLFFTLVVLVILLIIQFSGTIIALGSFLLICALTFVITYRVAGILTYYGLWVLKIT
ncbi:MAG TPA: hypothetical protein PLX23_08320 [Candidatus Hydrogenedens sp.]|nr:hypothetical protein [Candidatus Hydrogenedens sp.]